MESNFCHNCGTKLETIDPGLEIFNHVTNNVTSQKTHAAKWRRRIGMSHRMGDAACRERAEKHEKSMAKWKRWAEWIAERLGDDD
jgi:hypothetical protein